MVNISFRDEDIEKLKLLSQAYNEIYGDINDEERKWSFQDVDDMRQIGENFIEIVMLYINQNKNA